MIRLAGKKRDLPLPSFLLGDIAGNFRGADYFPGLIGHRGNGQRDLNQTSVLAAALSFEMIDRLAAPDAMENIGFLMQAFGRDDYGNRFANRLLAKITEQALSPLVPGLNNAVEIFADDGVVAGFDNGRKTTRYALRALVIADIDQDVDRADQGPCPVP